MKQNDRALFDRALQPARTSAFARGQFVGQESVLRATDIRSLAHHAGIGTGTSVLDLCCGVAGPGRLITRELRCSYLGVDSSPEAVELARERADGLDCRFEVARVPPLPAGPFDVILLLETILAFRDKDTLLREVASALRTGGRFAFTLEEGVPLTQIERARMPNADTVWLAPLPDMLSSLARAGLHVRWLDECSQAHLATVDALIAAFCADASAITAQIGGQALDELLTSHGLWSDWLREGRARKYALVAEKAS